MRESTSELSLWGGKASPSSRRVQHSREGIPIAHSMACSWLQNKTNPQKSKILIFFVLFFSGGRTLYCFFTPVFLFCLG